MYMLPTLPAILTAAQLLNFVSCEDGVIRRTSLARDITSGTLRPTNTYTKGDI